MSELLNVLSEYSAYNIVGHVRPDGDCIGSSIALCRAILSLGKQCFVIRTDQISENFKYFFYDTPCVDVQSFNPELPLICVDCSDYNRVNNAVRKAYNIPFLNIDHHLSNKNFAKNNIIYSTAASTTEILTRLFIGSNINITLPIAEALYLGILTDTGRFAYSATSIDTFKYAELMIKKGVTANKIYSIVYENNTLQRYKLLERLLSNIELCCSGKACLSFLTEEDFIETGASVLDTEGFVNYTRELIGVLIGCFLELHNDYIKCSLRCIDKSLRVDLLASKFGGGGHPCAAGFLISDNIENNFIERFKLTVIAHINQFYNDKIIRSYG